MIALDQGLLAIKVCAFIYILASPLIPHNSTSALNTQMFHLLAILISAASFAVDTTLGVLLLISSAIMIGSFNYHESQTQKPVIDMKSIDVKHMDEPESVPNLPSETVRPMEAVPQPPRESPAKVGEFCLAAVERNVPLDFLKISDFTTRENIEKVQTNVVSDEAMKQLYSPIGDNAYTAQGLLPGVDVVGVGI